MKREREESVDEEEGAGGSKRQAVSRGDEQAPATRQQQQPQAGQQQERNLGCTRCGYAWIGCRVCQNPNYKNTELEQDNLSRRKPRPSSPRKLGRPTAADYEVSSVVLECDWLCACWFALTTDKVLATSACD